MKLRLRNDIIGVIDQNDRVDEVIPQDF